MIVVGAHVGNYEIVKVLGEGAMGKVYLAAHPGIGKRVAMKVIHPELAGNEEMIGRFFNEARAVTQIGHENIVEVQDFGQTPDGDSFIIMELLEGRGLGTVLKAEGMLSISRAMHIGLQLADGLAAAHARGIIHRDLKPDNIHLVKRGSDPDFVKILDFGLAKMSGPQAGLLSAKTKTGSLLGTPHYMAPEQCEGKKNIDHRVDVYALGCILFHMVTGRVPFPGEGFGEVLVKQLREPPPLPSRMNPQVPSALEKIILHAMAKKADFRFATMDEFRTALRDPDRFALGDDAQTGPSVLPESMSDLETVPPKRRRGTPSNDARTAVAASAVARNGAASAPLPRPTRPTVTEPAARGRLGGGGRGLIIGVSLAAVVLVGLGVAALVGSKAPDVTMTIVTDPPGAQVMKGDTLAGVTPLVLHLPRADAPVDLTLEKAGYLAAKRSLVPHDSQEVVVRLLARPVAPKEPPPDSVKPADEPATADVVKPRLSGPHAKNPPAAKGARAAPKVAAKPPVHPKKAPHKPGAHKNPMLDDTDHQLLKPSF